MSNLINLPGSGIVRPTGLNIGGLITEVTLNSTTWTALPASPLAQRNAVAIQNTAAVEIKLNHDNSVAGYTGIAMAAGSERFYQITDNIIIYGKSSAGSVSVIVEELA